MKVFNRSFLSSTSFPQQHCPVSIPPSPSALIITTGPACAPNDLATPHDNFKETLKQQADIVRIVGDYVKLKKAGAQNFSGLCPFHAEKTPSFSVHATRQFFHCFGCGESGDVFTFVQKVENITFPEAVRLIAQKLGVPMPKVSFLQSSRGARCPAAHGAARCARARDRSFFRNVCGVPRARMPANISKVAGSMTRPSLAFASAMRRIPAFCCATLCGANLTKSCCGRVGCFRGRKTPQPQQSASAKAGPSLRSG